MKSLAHFSIFAYVALFTELAFAGSGNYSIGTSNVPFLTKLTTMLQDWVTWLGGVGAKAFVFFALFAGIVIFIFAPKMGPGLAMAARGVAGGIMLFGLTTLLASL